MRGFASKVTLVLLLLFIFLMIFAESVVGNALRDQYEMLTIAQELKDEIIDSGVVTEAMLKEFEARIAGYSSVVAYDITREMLVVEPDTMNSGEHVPSYIKTDDISHFNQGDHVTVHIYELSLGSTMFTVQNLFSVFVPKLDATFTGRVR